MSCGVAPSEVAAEAADTDVRPLRIALVSTVATSTPPAKSGSVEVMTALLADGLVACGHDVTLFATGDSVTSAKLDATFERGYWHDLSLWPWEFCEMLNFAAAAERATEFDLIHFQAGYYPMPLAFTRLCPTPIVQTVHHAPSPDEVRIWSRYAEAPYIAISNEQARLMDGLNIVGVVLHGIDTDAFVFRAEPEDYLLYLGRFTEGKGVLQAIEVVQRLGLRLILAGPNEDYFRDKVAPHVDGVQIIYFGEADHDAKVRLLGGARALLYPILAPEPFGLVLAEAAACGTPVAALDQGAVREVVEDGVTGVVFDDLEQMMDCLDRVLALDRRDIHKHSVACFGRDRMVEEYVRVYRDLIGGGRAELGRVS